MNDINEWYVYSIFMSLKLCRFATRFLGSDPDGRCPKVSKPDFGDRGDNFTSGKAMTYRKKKKHPKKNKLAIFLGILNMLSQQKNMNKKATRYFKTSSWD